MKEKNYILILALFHFFIYLHQSIVCPTGYIALPYGTEGYCAKCDTTCATCSNQGMNNCVTCPTDFTYNTDTSYCIPPNVKAINTLQSSYKFVGFTQVTGWTGGYPYTDSNFGPTIYRFDSASFTQISKQFTLTPAHYQLRILVSLWILDSAASTSDYISINFYPTGSTTTYKTITTNNLPLAGAQTPSGFQIYPTGWRAKNIDVTFPDSTHDTARIAFTSNTVNFGFRQFIFIQYLCDQTSCSRCDGPTKMSCLSCTMSPIRQITAAFPQQCLCNSATGYYKHPDFDYCVNPCPNRLDGQYYGDPDTKNCVLSCTNAAHYTDPSTGLCAATCSASITLGSISRTLYYDTRNKKCVVTCPSTEPYFNTADRTCYSTCPNSKFKNDQTMQCVVDCPDTGLVPLFGSGDKCVQQCIGADNWGDPNTHKCTATCSNDALGRKFFQDNSTKRNLCVRVCPFPQYFGDDITDPSQPYCDIVCPSGYYGDYIPPRHCVTKCNPDTVNGIIFYGLKNEARECVKVCPQGTWGQTTNNTCLQTAAQCSLDSNKYADNFTRTCVAKGTCSKGRYSLDSTSTCQITCPNGTYADDRTMHCQTSCTANYFADPGVNSCVLICKTQNLYADIYSGRKCVPICNQTGLTPFRDPTTKTCVNICPTDKQLFADTTAMSCVYNCTLGTYSYDNSPTDTNKTCVANCPGLFFGDNSTGYGVCVLRCPQNPILFGDVIGVSRVCVAVCQATKFGDQDAANGRLCGPTCPTGWYAQDDTLRRCVRRCNSTTYGYNNVCYLPANCPTDWVGDPSTNLCVSICPVSEGTFSDFNSRLCVDKCPIIGTVKYFADPTKRWCVTTCNASHNLFGNNLTLQCVLKCVDIDSYADAQHANRFCIKMCTDVGAVQYYRNNFTKTCVISTGCPTNYFADNNTQTCVAKCPIINSGVLQTWGHQSTQTCVNQCYGSLWGDASTGIPLCISLCPAVPAKWSFDGNMTCVLVCPIPLYGQDFTRTCMQNCPNTSTVGIPYQTFAYDGPSNNTRRCLKNCLTGTFGDYTTGICYTSPFLCTYGWGDKYNNSCVHLCTGPTPWDTFGDDATRLCTQFCTLNTYADSYTGTRRCVSTCPGTYDAFGNVTGSYDTFGDIQTRRCQTTCKTAGQYADWQTHKCQTRCTGDTAPVTTPTYSNNKNKRCVIALACPDLPDKLYGDNRTRTCITKCYFDASVIQWADNITRTCIPQCLNITTTAGYPYTTRFYGDMSTGAPFCVITCPTSPRLFGQNITNKCVPQCPDNRYGDQVNNRSCTADCYEWNGVIYYSQITQRLCVAYCQNGTFANWHNRHCQTVPTDCVPGQFGNDGNNSCVAQCPQNMDYFGDPSTKLCVKTCPNITVAVINVTANINQQPGYLYADYSTRLCVRTCPASHGLHGTFGDNLTTTCVQRCPTGSYGDPLTVNRHCVAVCTAQNFADTLSMQCVSRCPASPPYFGYKGDWTCVKDCPITLWADSSTRLCVDTCPGTTFRLTSFRRQCVNVCPSNPDLYGDLDSKNCQSVCTLGKFADPYDRTCKSNCLPLFQYNFRCVTKCPNGFYANSTGDCVLAASCDATVPYAQNRTTKCVSTCTGGSFADPNTKYCIAVCPDTWFGDGNICRQSCLTGGTSVSNITQTCVSSCPNLTYHENGACLNQCIIGYANDQLGSCHTSCPLGPPRLFANPVNHDCDAYCFSGYVKDLLTGFCVQLVNGCSGGLFSDQITGQCTEKCSTGYWGNLQNHTCLSYCVSGQYGYQSSTQRTCYVPLALPGTAPTLYADPQSKTFIPVCPTTPKLYFADTILNLCVQTCVMHNSVEYYGDPSTRKCQSSCTNITFYTADPLQDKCVLKCTLGTFSWDNAGDPICKDICPSGFADSSTRICVPQCPILADTYGFVNTTSAQRICVSVCPTNFYADPFTRQCNPTCDPTYNPPLFADNTTNKCAPYCTNAFADKSNFRCMDKCYSSLFPNADNSTNQCVLTCPSSPDYYSQNNICVKYCVTPNYFADSSTRSCVSRCPNVTGASSYNSYADSTTGRCVKKCPQLFWGDNSTNKCIQTCPTDSFADNDTRLCVAECPRNQSIYADPFLHTCAYTCSNGYFGSQITQKCIETCQNGATQNDKYWGDSLSTMCVKTCPSSIYSYGQNVTRKCVQSCVPYGTYGFADNFSRICRSKCQDTIVPQTYADPTSSACVQRCPDGYFAQNSTNQCVRVCLTGFADNYTRYCVAVCPDDPQLYGQVDANGNKICVAECLGGKFSNNDTNLCDIKCPTVPDFFGDRHTGRCVYFCTQGTYAQNGTRQCMSPCPSLSYADNLTRRCVEFCPVASQGTYRDTTTQKCVRVCPDLWWAENTSAICVNDCPKYANGTQSYEDNISKYCVAQCPYPYYGKKDTHQCVKQCSAARLLFGHNQGRVCVPLHGCFAVGITKYYADPVSGTCVQVCPQTHWAQDNTFTCVTDCNPLVTNLYRNLNNQKCVSLCPQDPAQFSDDFSGNCVSTCPPNSYSYANAAGTIRKCVPSCQPYGLYADNSTNRCVSTCPTNPFMYADINTYKCVYQCGDYFYFADNKTQTCVATCPVEWELWGQRINYTCVQLCPDGYYADPLDNRQCNQQCTSPRFADKYTSRCIVHCNQTRRFYYKDTSTGTNICLDQCPFDSYGYNPDQVCKYKLPNLSSSCPGLYFADRDSKQCVTHCPPGTYADSTTKYCQVRCLGSQFADNATRSCQPQCTPNYFALVVDATNNTCVQFCPSPYYAQNSSHSCVPGCSSLFKFAPTRSCQTYCPQPYFKFISQLQCRTNCTPLFADRALRQCLPVCNSPNFANPLTYTCDLLCPDGYYGNPVGRVCSDGCGIGFFADPSTRLCVQICPDYPLLYADDILHECVEICEGRFGYANSTHRICVSSCPNITINASLTLVYLKDISNSLCVLQCINQLISFADYKNNQCTARCPDKTFANNFTKQCVPQCPRVPNDTFAENTSHICMETCPIDTFGSRENLYCVADCWWPTFEDQTTRLCVDTCPLGYFGQNQTARCTPQCDPGTYADPTSRRCVLQCPLLHDLFKYDQGWACVSQCPQTFYSDDTVRKCKKLCNVSGMYAYQQKRQCVRQCPIPYRAYDVNNTCILNCPYLYFYNITRNKCTKCPVQCLVCTSPTACLTCASGYNLFNGICDISCQPNNGIITYSNPQGICVRICPFTWYGNNISYACVQTCPIKQYGSNDTQLCQNCPLTCASCYSPSHCITCEAAATLAIDKMCYRDCNTTHKYFFNQTCHNSCPNGTYLTYTNVHCGACAASCATCNETATNCLSCVGRYFYNFSCLTQCPTNYFGNSSFICQLCVNGSTNPACLKPLNFTTDVQVQGFKYVVYLKFNQQIDIKQQIQKIINIKLKVVRRLLDVNQWINNGIKYTWEILPGNIIKLTLILDASITNPQFTVQITDPTAIVSLNGGASLQNTAADFVIQKVQYYAPQTGTKAQTNTASKFVVIFVLLLYAFSFFWTDATIKSIQFLQLALLHATLNVNIPPILAYYLYQLKRSIMYFTPNFFLSSLNPETTYHRSPQKIVDMLVDYDFLRNLGQIFFFIILFAGMWLILLFLSSKKLISNKLWFNLLDDTFKRRFKFMAINDVISLFVVPIVWFAIWQFKDLKGTGLQQSYVTINSAFTVIFLIIALVLPIIWTFFWCKFSPSRFQQQCSFMCKRVKKVELSYQIYSQASNQEIKQKQDSKQLTEDKMSRHLAEQQKMKNPNHQLETVISYWYFTLMSIWLVALYDNVLPQLVLLLVTNGLYVAYILYFRPYVNIVNTIMTPLMAVPLVLLQAYMIYFNANDKTMSSDYKTGVAKNLIYMMTIIYILKIFWTIWRVVYDGIDTVNYFKKSQFYKIYGDNDHINEEQISQTYEKFQKKAVELETQIGDQIIEKIYKTVNEHGDSVIKVKKKILKKKQKIQGRKKVAQSSANYNQIDEDSSEQDEKRSQKGISNIQKTMHKQQKMLQVQQQYVRVNKPTPFQLAQQIQSNLKKAKDSLKSKSNFKSIDDDLRQSQYDEQDFQGFSQVDKQQNVKNSSSLKQTNKSLSSSALNKQQNQQKYYKNKNSNRNKKVIVQVQDEQSSIHDLEDIFKNQDYIFKKKQVQKLKQKQQELPFEFISENNQQETLNRQKQEQEEFYKPNTKQIRQTQQSKPAQTSKKQLTSQQVNSFYKQDAKQLNNKDKKQFLPDLIQLQENSQLSEQKYLQEQNSNEKESIQALNSNYQQLEQSQQSQNSDAFYKEQAPKHSQRNQIINLESQNSQQQKEINKLKQHQKNINKKPQQLQNDLISPLKDNKRESDKSQANKQMLFRKRQQQITAVNQQQSLLETAITKLDQQPFETKPKQQLKSLIQILAAKEGPNNNNKAQLKKKKRQQGRILDLEQLLVEEEQNKNKKLMFLFDDAEDEDEK